MIKRVVQVVLVVLVPSLLPAGCGGDDGPTDPDDESLDAEFTYSPENPTVNERINLDASASTGQFGEVYYWTFDDGSGLQAVPQETFGHRYDSPGTYTITLEICRTQSNCDQESQDVTVTQ